MHHSYNIPQRNQNMQLSSNYRPYSSVSYPNIQSNDDRFFFGGALGPFLLGGVAGSLISRPNYGYPPPPIIYYPPPPMPYYNNNYYYNR